MKVFKNTVYAIEEVTQEDLSVMIESLSRRLTDIQCKPCEDDQRSKFGREAAVIRSLIAEIEKGLK